MHVVPVEEQSQQDDHEDDLSVEKSVGLGLVISLNRGRCTYRSPEVDIRY